MSLDSSPYTAPSSDISINNAKGEEVFQLPKFSAWGVLFLMIITLGIYYYYWLYSRTKVINRICDRKISSILTGVVLSLFVVSLILSLYRGLTEDSGSPYDLQLALAEAIFNIACSIATLFWLYAIRNRLHYMCKLNKRSAFWMSGFLTFIANAIYLQYKINQVIEHKEHMNKIELNDKFQPSQSFDDGVLRATR
ncbi:DUF4234 domain-containing protein [Zooshikella ganghwensis]|uniref:DUF4234 domain-containing protein n=1 Tax=Zooshikella ganghwensis TaxID=202772 RepID=A0A4P9VS17_9GAMM|nr:DUF4234 domain-containing protein [Zooshikella ganghwensis]RDH46408.1 DUF4234 domain-containing protein [Zooshikella ganghwensis]